MAQNHLIFYYTSPIDGQTYYEANTVAAYDLVRSGKLIQVVRRRFGTSAANIVMHLLVVGQARIEDLERATNLSTDEGNKNAGSNSVKIQGGTKVNGLVANGDHNTKQEEERGFSETLQLLATEKLICRVREAHLRSEEDIKVEVARHVKATGRFGTLKGRKLQEAIDERSQAVIEEWYDGRLSGETVTMSLPTGIKRKSGYVDAAASNKRPRRTNGTPHEMFEDEKLLKLPTTSHPGIVVQVNHARAAALLRNARLVTLAHATLGSTASQVYQVLLDRVEENKFQPRLPTELRSVGIDQVKVAAAPVSLRQISAGFEGKATLSEVLASADPTKIDWRLQYQGSHKKAPRPFLRASGEFAEDSVHCEDSDENDYETENTTVQHDSVRLPDGQHDSVGAEPASRLELVEQHLLLLSQSPYGFAVPSTAFNNARWTVDFHDLLSKVRNEELHRMVKAQFGPTAVRLVRVLETRGKLDEKRIQDLALLSPKDCRTMLESLNKGGFLEIQEVPRDSHRQPSRTMYLWFYDSDRVRKQVLENTYKAMSRCMQRIKVEREKYRGVIENAERSDVKGNEAELLPEAELNVLEAWKRREERVFAEVGRLDELVGVLRDE